MVWVSLTEELTSVLTIFWLWHEFEISKGKHTSFSLYNLRIGLNSHWQWVICLVTSFTRHLINDYTTNIASDSCCSLKAIFFFVPVGTQKYHLFWFDVWKSLHISLLENYFPLVLVGLCFNVMWLDNSIIIKYIEGEGRFIRQLNYWRCYCCKGKSNYL